MQVKRLELRNFRGIRGMVLKFPGKLTVLSGVNGAGKSSVLEALAIMLSRFLGNIRSTKGTGRFFTEYDIKNGEAHTANQIFITYDDQQVHWTVSKRRSGRKTLPWHTTDLKELKPLVERIQEALEAKEDYCLPIAVFYGVNRAVSEIPLRSRTKHDYGQLAAYDQALTGKRNDFRSFFEWFRGREDYENELRSDRRDHEDPQLESVRRAIEEFTGFKGLRVRRKTPLRMEVKKAGETYDIRQMSDGEKCLLALVGDLARRLAIANPALEDPLKGEGVVLIDEIDLHLHPTWQRMVAPKLREVFPNCQFILSTHSPQVLGEVDAANIRCLYQEDSGIKCYTPDRALGLDSSEILEEVMDTARQNGDVAKQLDIIFRLIDADKFEGAKRKIASLRKKLGGDTPDLIRADSLLFMMEKTEDMESAQGKGRSK